MPTLLIILMKCWRLFTEVDLKEPELKVQALSNSA
jgi:hypothetical protein